MAPWHRIGPRSARRDLIRLSHAGLAGRTLLTEALARLRQVLPVEAYFAATTDPATVLFTDTVRDGIPPAAPPLFLTAAVPDQRALGR